MSKYLLVPEGTSPKPPERCVHGRKCFNAGMSKYLRVPVGTGSPKPRHAEGCSFDLTVEMHIPSADFVLKSQLFHRKSKQRAADYLQSLWWFRMLIACN